MDTLTHGAGYLEIDHRESPGLTPTDVAHVPGAIAVGAGQRLERDVLQCSHCQRAVLLVPMRKRRRGYCPKCHRYLCDLCEAIRAQSGGACTPMAQVLDCVQEHLVRFLGREDHPLANPSIVLTDLMP